MSLGQASADRSAAPRRVGMLGGSFDPPHLAHRALADLALSALQLDALHWLPARAPWQKAGREMAPAADREAMLRLAIGGQPRFAIDPRLTAALSRTEFLILHFSALDAAKRGDIDKSLKLFDAITLISGLSLEDWVCASGDRLLGMESRQDGV